MEQIKQKLKVWAEFLALPGTRAARRVGSEGFIPMIIMLLTILGVAIYLAFKHVTQAQH